MKKCEKLSSKNSLGRSKKRRRIDYMRPICWIIVPAIIVVLLMLDAHGIYTFNEERLIVLGIGLLVILTPFFSEITVKDVTVKRINKSTDESDT